jgi:CRP/FNR family transcriptional regulator, cyclic AMP receptor protein
MTEPGTSPFELLRRTHFAAGLSAEAVKSLADNSRLFDAPKGTVLFTEGMQQDEIYVLSSGRAALEMAVPRRGNVRLLTVGSGELIGWSGLIADGCMTATATVTEDATLIGMSSRRLLALCEQDPGFGYLLMLQTSRAVSRRLLATRLQLLDLFSETEPVERHGS